MLDSRKYEVNQNLDKPEEFIMGFILTDVIPLIASIIFGGIFRFWLLIIPGFILTVFLRLSHVRYSRGFIQHLIYRWTGFGAIEGRIPPGDNSTNVFYE